MKPLCLVWKPAVLFLFVLTVSVLIPTGVQAQQLVGSIIGTVTDPSHAPIVGAKVEARNVATQVTRTVTTNGSGDFEAASLMPGFYNVTVQAEGFTTKVIDNVSLAFGARLRVDVELVVGQVTTRVNVMAISEPMETDTARINEDLTTKKVLDLPYNQADSRDYLSRLIPGTAPAESGVFSGVGLDNVGIGTSVDGIEDTNTNNGLGTSLNSLDAVESVSYNEVNQTAEVPFPSTLSMVSKSGGPQFHGSAFEYMGKPDWNARNFFASTAPTGPMSHRFGGTFSGPIIKDRLFFFVDIQYQRSVVPNQIRQVVPTDKVRGGDLSGLTQAHNPFTGANYAGNIVPVNPTSTKILNFYYPEPNLPIDQNFGYYNATYNATSLIQNYNFRVDYRLTDKQNMTVRYQKQYSHTTNGNNPVNLNWGTTNSLGPRYQVSVSHTYAISTRLLNDFRGSFDTAPGHSTSQLKGADIVNNTLGLLGYPSGVISNDIPAIPSFSITNLGQFGSPRLNFRWDTFGNIIDTMTVIRGKHTFKGGIYIRPLKKTQPAVGNNLQLLYGSANFTSKFTGLAIADFLLGLPSTSTNYSRYDLLQTRANQWQWFAQDDIRVNSKLTLNLGVRWESSEMRWEASKGEVSAFDYNTGKVIIPGQAQFALLPPAVQASVPVEFASDAGLPPKTLANDHSFRWLPRVGLAYRPFGDTKTVVRIGYGLYKYEIATAPVGGAYSGQQAFTNSITGGVPLYQLPTMFPSSGGTATTIQPGSYSPGTVGSIINSNARRSYVQEWNVTLERMLTPNTSMRVSYIGSEQTHLPILINFNTPPPSTLPFAQSRRPYPFYADIISVEWIGNDSLNGLTATLERRFSKGLVFDLTYMLQHFIGDAYGSDGTLDGLTAGTIYQGWAGINRFCVSCDRGNIPWVPRNRLFGTLIWELPYGRGRMFGRNTSRRVDAVLGGWQLSGITVISSGNFYWPYFSGPDPANTNQFLGYVNQVGDPHVSNQTLGQWFNPAAFALPASGTYGNVAPNTLVGPSRWDQDMGLYKDFHIGENKVIRVEGTFINVFNHPNFAVPNANISSPTTAGKITSTQNAEGGGGRTIQVGFHFHF